MRVSAAATLPGLRRRAGGVMGESVTYPSFSYPIFPVTNSDTRNPSLSNTEIDGVAMNVNFW